MSNNSGSKHSSPSSPNLETLISRNSYLRDKNDILEDELTKLKVDQVSWDVERSRLLREFEVLDNNLKDLTRKLGFSKESETNAIKRYDRAMEYSREVEAKMEVLKRGFQEERGDFAGKFSVLKDELTEKEVELRELRKRNKVSEAELGDLRVRNEELGKELGRIEAVVRKKDEEIGELRRRNEELDGEKEELLERIEVLENEKLEIVKNKDGKIEELKKAKAGLEKEKTEIMAIDKMKEVKLLKLESDVATYCWLVAKRGVMFQRSLNEKILSLVDNTLCGEPGNGETAGNLDAEPAFVSHVNVSKCEETVKATVLSSEVLVGENGEDGNLKSQSPAYIQISDSDDDEISRHVRGLKRSRASSVCSIQKHRDDSSSDESQNPKRKIKKLESVLGEIPKYGQPIAESDSRSDNKSSTLPKQTVATIRKCMSNKPNILEYMEKRQQHLKKNNIADVADMVLACQKDPEFCTKAVCALYRNHLLSYEQKGLEKRDIDRALALAKYLVGGDPNSDKKKSVDELKQRYPDGLNTCKKLILGYSDKLFDIFKSNKDSLFSQKSTEMQFR
ncbi:uncharacterized protein LOC141599234 [Silene latifolia]|uniref:uncharacterized protein LOC141599234 n=1 Tax=Silene latifolia TaxID=37657 RepID=UPI003D77D5A9